MRVGGIAESGSGPPVAVHDGFCSVALFLNWFEIMCAVLLRKPSRMSHPRELCRS